MDKITKKSSDQPQRSQTKDLSGDEATRIDDNLISFIELLIKLDRQNKEANQQN